MAQMSQMIHSGFSVHAELIYGMSEYIYALRTHKLYPFSSGPRLDECIFEVLLYKAVIVWYVGGESR